MDLETDKLPVPGTRSDSERLALNKAEPFQHPTSSTHMGSFTPSSSSVPEPAGNCRGGNINGGRRRDGGRSPRNVVRVHGDKTNNSNDAHSTSRQFQRGRSLYSDTKIGRQPGYRNWRGTDGKKTGDKEQNYREVGMVAATGSEKPSAIIAMPFGQPTENVVSGSQSQPRRLHNIAVDPARIVKRPLPKNTRHFQLTQLQRRFRFGGDGTAIDNNTEFQINLAPSDPEFPYPIDVLTFVLKVPPAYGTPSVELQPPDESDLHPTIRVLNQDIPTGFRINIERGFSNIAAKASREATLLDMVNTLDRNLESLLGNEKASIITIVPNARIGPTCDVTTPPRHEQLIIVPENDTQSVAVIHSPRTHFTDVNRKLAPAPDYTAEQRAIAARKREQDVRQLEARLRGFVKSQDGNLYTLPFKARKKELLPVPLQNIHSVKLHLPLLYNLEPCRIEFPGISDDINATVGKHFEKQVMANPSWSLMSHLNALSANLHVMATTKHMPERQEEASLEQQELTPESVAAELSQVTIGETAKRIVPTKEEDLIRKLDDKEHVYVISRPPEWSYVDGDSDIDTEDEESSDLAETNENEEKKDEEIQGEQPLTERGTSLSFPNLQMSRIQLLEVLVLNIVTKCNRCKTLAETLNLKPGDKVQYRRCDCSNVHGIGFRAEMIHEHSHRAGFFDLYGCTVAEILPSNFVPQCASCETSLPPPGISGLVPGQTFWATCRRCHNRMSLLIPEMKLLRITRNDVTPDTGGKVAGKKKEKDPHIVAGTELPDRGRCRHYRKSTRWFRFSCCMKVYPCDKCHDEQQSHPTEHANRMICGMCSREQYYRPNGCAFCGHSYIRRYTGYWEGGKGTRDRVLLRRNDPRKKRLRTG